jgi:hypothetical protein
MHRGNIEPLDIDRLNQQPAKAKTGTTLCTNRNESLKKIRP